MEENGSIHRIHRPSTRARIFSYSFSSTIRKRGCSFTRVTKSIKVDKTRASKSTFPNKFHRGTVIVQNFHTLSFVPTTND